MNTVALTSLFVAIVVTPAPAVGLPVAFATSALLAQTVPAKAPVEGEVPADQEGDPVEEVWDLADREVADYTRLSLQAEWFPGWAPYPLIGFRMEPSSDEGFHGSLGLSLVAHPAVLMAPTGILEGGLAYSLPLAKSMTLVARAGPSVFGGLSLSSGGWGLLGGHAGVGLLLGGEAVRLRLEYTARRWFTGVDDDFDGFLGHGLAVGVTWGT